LRREIGDMQRLLAGLVGRAPRFFRAPAGIRSPLLQRELERRQLGLVSWTVRGYDAVLRDPQRLLRRLDPRLRAGAIVVLHDGRTLNRRSIHDAPVLDVLPRLLDTIRRRELRAVTLEAGLR
jgi:peptidoglycan/xylan/chitin deacetylase (PgdA/CDA1 family)